MSLPADLKLLIDKVYEWASRPTKNGAKDLRAFAAKLENDHLLEHWDSIKPIPRRLVSVFYDRKNKCEVKHTDLIQIKLISYYAGLDNEGFAVGTPTKTLTDKYGDDLMFVAEEQISEFGYKSNNCPDYMNWDNHCNYADLVFLRFE